MNRPAKPAPVQFYIDADVLGLAKILVQVRGDVTYPGDPGGPVKGGRVRAPCPIADSATRDDVWIPETARAARASLVIGAGRAWRRPGPALLLALVVSDDSGSEPHAGC
jgi:hypothetical protein